MVGQQTEVAELGNLSEGGCFVATRNAVAPGRPISVVLNGAHGLCGASGRIVRWETGGFGVEFSDTNAEFKRFLRDLASVDGPGRATIVAGIAHASVRVG